MPGKRKMIKQTLSETERRNRGPYTDKDHIRIAVLWVKLGNFSKAAELCGVPYYTAKEWKEADWFKALVENVKREVDLEKAGELDDVVRLAMKQMKQRLTKGDVHITKTGEVIMVPPKLADLNRIVSQQISNVRVLREQPKNYTENTGSTANRLEKLAEAFKSFASGKKPKLTEDEVIDVEVITDDSSTTTIPVREATPAAA